MNGLATNALVWHNVSVGRLKSLTMFGGEGKILVRTLKYHVLYKVSNSTAKICGLTAPDAWRYQHIIGTAKHAYRYASMRKSSKMEEKHGGTVGKQRIGVVLLKNAPPKQ